MSCNLWPAVRDWLDASGYYDLFVAAQDFREDHPQFAAALAAARSRFSLTPDQVAAALAESVADWGATRLLCRVNKVTGEIMPRSRPVEDP